MKKIVFLIMIVLMSSSVLGLTHITTCAGLQNMKNNLVEDYVLDNDINCDVSPYNTGSGFEPVGSSSSKFTGSLDGDGYAITGLYISRAGVSNVGLFGNTYTGASVSNLILENVDITGGDATGALVGSAEDLDNTFTQIKVSGSVHGTIRYTGGIIGVLFKGDLIR